MIDFIELTIEQFSFLTSKFNYKVIEKHNKNLYQYVIYHSNKCDVKIYCEYSRDVGLTITALGDIPKFKADMSREIDLFLILDFIKPEEKDLGSIEDNIPRKLEKMRELLLNYCQPILCGDVSTWPEINKKMQFEREEFQKSPEKYLDKLEKNIDKSKRKLP